MQTTRLKLSAIKPNPDNPRIIKDEKYQQLLRSLRDFPEMIEAREVVVNSDHVILGGNMRYKAMQELGVKDVPVKVVDWSEDKQREFIAKDNIGYGEWDWETLANEWDVEQLQDWGLDLPEDWQAEPDEVEEDEAPEVDESVPAVSKLGEVYQLGRHRLMCGDATKHEDVDRLMGGVKADMVFTDPPYGVSFSSNRALVTAKFDVLKNDDVMLTEWVDVVRDVSNGFVFVWTTWKVFSEWLGICAAFGDVSNTVIWNKGGGGIGDLEKTFSTDYEMAIVYNRGAKLTSKRIGSVWDIGKDSANLYEHPTQKPVGLAAYAINHTTTNKAKVLDVFGGSGSTLIACEQTNRTCYMMELDPKYCDVIRKRYAKIKDLDNWENTWQDMTHGV